MEKDSEWMLSKVDYENKILKYREQGYEYLEKINDCLGNQNEENIEVFLNIYREKQFLNDVIICLPELMYANIFAAITDEERRNGTRPLFIENGNSVAELITLLKKIEFCLWRIEFDSGADAEHKFFEYLREFRISVAAIDNIIKVAGMDKRNCYLTLACIYIERQCLDEAVKLLSYGLEQFPDDELIRKYLHQLCMKTGRSTEVEQKACSTIDLKSTKADMGYKHE